MANGPNIFQMLLIRPIENRTVTHTHTHTLTHRLCTMQGYNIYTYDVLQPGAGNEIDFSLIAVDSEIMFRFHLYMAY